ncbi:pimeloyl-ACP methyl ester carboxylesterase [Mycolicibacterium sp. BK556]|uniref:alpha/beta fold hydrolase n=2 Tax=Mycobacteriaceae TaxID=1762 RepID=UPI001608BF08|nr:MULTISPECIES: alpha/beta hydrolase [unclassified Mycolicibacterium]MBB3605573.1 pimeloyl-ACP methyl ester carboxylesterase [Mycolicibacterium sp. BK556]MBB3635930.1 pimeloyl-ACP methyl ester carboxylesterase [Mycolicibacterium sp. BK607]
MTTTAPSRSRVRLSHQVLRLEDGHRVSVWTGGHGVPLVFLHGYGLNGRAYLRLLSRLGGLGFTVIAVDAAGHGRTPTLPAATTLEDRVDLTLRALDVLGIDKAVFLGHSMGGRMIVDLAARAPERVLAAVLLNAAAGAPFDESIAPGRRSPRAIAARLVAAAVDAQGDPRGLSTAELVGYARLMTGVLTRNARAPLGLTRALRALLGSGDFAAKLATMRDHAVPTIVVHGERDGVVPFDNAYDMAERADASLYCVPGAHHSWMLAHPRQAADMMRQLLRAELGHALAAVNRRTDADELGSDETDPVELELLRSPTPRRHAHRRRFTLRWLRLTG